MAAAVALPIAMDHHAHLDKMQQMADGASTYDEVEHMSSQDYIPSISLDDSSIIDTQNNAQISKSAIRDHILAVQKELSDLKLLTTPPSHAPPPAPQHPITMEPSPEPASLPAMSPKVLPLPSVLRRPLSLTPPSPALPKVSPAPVLYRPPSPITVREARASLTTSDIEGSMKDKQSQLAELQQRYEKMSQEQANMEEFWKEVNEVVKQQIPSSSFVQKSSANRMQEEREKKRLLAAWRANHPGVSVDDQRRETLMYQQNLANIRQDIIAKQKEISDLKLLAAVDISSHLIMRTARQKREQGEKKTINIEELPPLPFLQPPPQPPQRSHLSRMAERQAMKEKERTQARTHAKGPAM